MNENVVKAFELEEQAAELPDGQAKVALLEEAVRYIDLAEDADAGYQLRHELMSAAMMAGRSDVLLVAFSWCLSEYDRNPEYIDYHDLLWKYKWILQHAPEFLQMERSQIDSLFLDMERRYLEHGASLYSVYLLKRCNACTLGDLQAATQAHQIFLTQPRDDLSDCVACVANLDSCYYFALGDWEQSLAAAMPVLEKHMACASQPHESLARVLLPLLHLGKVEQAEKYARQGYKLVKDGPRFDFELALHLQFQVLMGECDKALRMLERHLPKVMAAAGKLFQLEMFLAADLLCHRLLRQGTTNVKLRLPKETWPDRDGNDVEVKAFAAWTYQQAESLALAYDRRNGNAHYQTRLSQNQDLLKLAKGA